MEKLLETYLLINFHSAALCFALSCTWVWE